MVKMSVGETRYSNRPPGRADATAATTSRWSWASRLTGIGFALGSLAHATRFAFVLLGTQLAPPDHPAWRDPVLTLFDATTACVAWRRPRWLFFFLLVFLIEQAIWHGPDVRRQWTEGQDLPWILLVTDGLVVIALIVAAINRWRPHANARR
jgi:hypothetical protein